MSDVEWYVEIGGQRTGPVSPMDLVNMYHSGKLPGNAMATTARMQGDWVTIADLVEAYRELHQTSKPAASTHTSHSDGPSFQAPPRPTEQIEASKIINLNPSDGTMDATESLFLAIQAVREKSASKNSTVPTSIPTRVDTLSGAPTDGKNQLIIAAIVVLMVGAYGANKLLKSDPSDPKTAQKTETESASSVAPERNDPPPTTTTTRTFPATNSGGPKSKLLTEGGGGAVRTAPPVTLPRGGGAVRLNSTPPVEARDRRDLRDSAVDDRNSKDAREGLEPKKDEFGDNIEVEGDTQDPPNPNDAGEADRMDNPDAPHTSGEGIAPDG